MPTVKNSRIKDAPMWGHHMRSLGLRAVRTREYGRQQHLKFLLHTSSRAMIALATGLA
jgi:hypothetical protein